MHNKKHEYYLTIDDVPMVDTEGELMIYLSKEDAQQMAEWVSEETSQWVRVNQKNWWE